MQIKRVYDDPNNADGFRVLVDRLWPRGVSKDAAAVDAWMKDVTPSDTLRKRYHADELAFDDFAEYYRAELAGGSDELNALAERLRAGETVTLIYAARDESQNHAMVLRDVLAGLAGA